MNIQALIDGMSAQMQRERAQTQMTLGGLIAALEAMPEDALIDGIDSPHSYRGYYSDLSFEMADGKRSARETLAMCRAAMGKVFEGYKGGDFMMGALTPLWIASYGSCGDRIMELTKDGKLVTAEDD